MNTDYIVFERNKAGDLAIELARTTNVVEARTVLYHSHKQGAHVWMVHPDGGQEVIDERGNYRVVGLEPKLIKNGQKITGTNWSDHTQPYEIQVIERQGQFATITDHRGRTRRTKIRRDDQGNEYLAPDKYSLAPTFWAP